MLYIGEKVGLKPKTLDVKFIDAHIYHNHHEAVFEYLKAPWYANTEYTYKNEILTLKNYKPGKIIKAPVAI
jgi:thymidylate synthase